jgi:hypothetical protein
MDDRTEAADALASIREHQERARRRARLPRWYYAAMFVLIAAGSAANDLVTLAGAKFIAVLVLVALIGTLTVSFATGSSLLGTLRGVQPRPTATARVSLVFVLAGLVLAWVVANYVSSATGQLGPYPNTVAGLIYAAVFTGLFALGRRLNEAR